MTYPFTLLFRITYRACFADNRDFHLSRISHFILYLLGYIVRHLVGVLVGYLLAADYDAQFTARLYGVSLHYAGVGESDIFHFLEAFDIRLYDLAPRSRACAGYGVANLHDGRQQRGHFSLVVVGADSVADVGFFLVLLGELHTYDGVRQFRLVVGHFADIVQEARTARGFWVESQFRCHDTAKVSGFAGVLEKVLSV